MATTDYIPIPEGTSVRTEYVVRAKRVDGLTVDYGPYDVIPTEAPPVDVAVKNWRFFTRTITTEATDWAEATPPPWAG